MKVVDKLEKFYDRNLILVVEGETNYCEYMSESEKERVERLKERNNFTGKKGEVLSLNFIQNDRLISMDILGFGKKEEITDNLFREVIFKYLLDKKGSILISTNTKELVKVEILCEIVGNINYSFDEFKEKKSEKLDVEFFNIELTNLEESLILNEATDVTRNLVDLPANIINPITLAERTVELGKEFGFEVEVLDDNKIQELGMNLLYSVGKASVTKPRLPALIAIT